MRKNEFIRYLTTPKDAKDKPLAPSTAREMASLCSSIEKEYGMDLDDAFQDHTEESRLFDFADSIKRANPQKYQRALWNYKDFFHNTLSLMLIQKGHFKFYPDAAPDGIDDELLGRMESEYECIMAFGRDEFFAKACKEDIERIPVILSPEIKKKTYKSNEVEIAKQICELAQKKHGDIHEQEILAILKRLKGVTSTILGEFIKADEPYIILYYKAIGGNTPEEKIAGLAKTLAHEYMHYMEYKYCLSKGVVSSENKKLSEAMADFFGVLYVLQRKWFSNYALNEKADVAERRYNEWVDRFGTCWPYAEALHFYTVGGKAMGFSTDYFDYVIHGSVEKLCNVFKGSYDSDSAYNLLLRG